jgi:hypothetical protein
VVTDEYWAGVPMGRVTSEFEAVPREDAVKADGADQMTSQVRLTKSLQRVYEPVTDEKPDRFAELLIKLEERLAERRRD